MGWTKRQFIAMAYEEIGLADYFFDLQPEQLMSACSRMDAMVASWNSKGVRIGYPLATSPSTTNIDEDTGVPDAANEAIFLNLAIRLGRVIGKTLPPDRLLDAKTAYLNLLSFSMDPTPTYQLPSTMPRGAGQKPWRNYDNPFMPTPCDPVDVGPDGILELN